MLRALRLGSAALYARTLDDPDLGVRIQAVRALVSVDAGPELARAAADPSREVRVAAAKGLGTVGTPDDLKALLADPDALVRAAALTALATTGCPPPLATAVAAASTTPPGRSVRARRPHWARRHRPGGARPDTGPVRHVRRRPQGRRPLPPGHTTSKQPAQP